MSLILIKKSSTKLSLPKGKIDNQKIRHVYYCRPSPPNWSDGYYYYFIMPKQDDKNTIIFLLLNGWEHIYDPLLIFRFSVFMGKRIKSYEHFLIDSHYLNIYLYTHNIKEQDLIKEKNANQL